MFKYPLLLYPYKGHINSILHALSAKVTLIFPKHAILLIQDHSLYSNIMIHAWKMSCNMVSFSNF